MKNKFTKNNYRKKNNNLDFLTVVLLTHNRKDYSQIALRAILKQSYSNFKILIIDNHSTDGTVAALTSQIIDDERVTYIRLNKCSNAGNSFHQAVMLSRSEFVLITHDDDIFDLNYVENIIKVFSSDSNIGLIASNAKLINQNGDIVNDRLYDLNEDLEIKKDKYLDFYLNKKIWLPTPSLCFRKIHYLNYIGHDIYPMHTKKKAIENKGELVKYTPSGDILFNLYINQFQKIYLFHHPYFSYRQHSGQESRNVNQSDPMVWLFENIRKYKIKIKNIHKYINIKAKYTIQGYLFNNDLIGLKNYLGYEKKCLHVLLAKKMFLNDKESNPLSDDFLDDPYGKFFLYIQENLQFKSNELILNARPIVLVGSMLCSFYIDAFLRSRGITPDAVIDFAKSRQGKFISNNKILSYEDFFDSKKEPCLFIITSEREKDISITNKIKDYTSMGQYIYWQELFI